MKSALPFAVVVLCCTSSLAQARIEKLYTLGEF